MRKRSAKVILAGILALLVAGTIGLGLYYEHYFVVFVFGVWLCVEFLVWRSPILLERLGPKTDLLDLFELNTRETDQQLMASINQHLLPANLSSAERKRLECLRALLELRTLSFGERGEGRLRLRQAFTYQKTVTPGIRPPAKLKVETSEITEGATMVAGLYFKLFECVTGTVPKLKQPALELYESIFGLPFDENEKERLEHLIDSMQRDSGIPYLVLNLLREGQTIWAREITQGVLRDTGSVDEVIRSSLYWISEIHWFSKEKQKPLTDYESSIRYLYHVCFINPDRAGFLEIDSQFYSQFTMINELAREGFLFKEVLMEKLLGVWSEHNELFDPIFQHVFETMTGQKSKIYDNIEYWKRFWSREKEAFSREYLYVVEGNICFAAGHFQDAVLYYEKALQLAPELRPALLNLPFCYARLGDLEKHAAVCERISHMEALRPTVLYVVGNSYLLLGDEQKADQYYEALKGFEGWETKGDHYKSTFCYEHGLYEMALSFAKKAHALNPNDVVIRYHLSLCYNAVGEKDKALEMVKKVGTAPAWLNYYRFTLERDSGRHGDASKTLLNLPSDYFDDDPEELDEAVSFARLKRDLVLLRHLKRNE